MKEVTRKCTKKERWERK